METTTTERDLVLRFREARDKKEAVKSALDVASQEYDSAEAALIELLQSRNASATARYAGVGYVSLVKPRLYASCKKENEARLFEFLEQEGRVDLVKQTVNAAALSGFVKEKVEVGAPIPEFITFFLQPSVRLYES